MRGKAEPHQNHAQDCSRLMPQSRMRYGACAMSNLTISYGALAVAVRLCGHCTGGVTFLHIRQCTWRF